MVSYKHAAAASQEIKIHFCEQTALYETVRGCLQVVLANLQTGLESGKRDNLRFGENLGALGVDFPEGCAA